MVIEWKLQITLSRRKRVFCQIFRRPATQFHPSFRDFRTLEALSGEPPIRLSYGIPLSVNNLPLFKGDHVRTVNHPLP